MRPQSGAVLLLSSLLCTGSAFAQAAATEDANELAFFKLEETLNKSTQVASTKEKSVRESPGIITVISREDIVNSGARDLLDVLQLVPGFHVVFSDLGVVTVSVRGLQGGVVLLIDGIAQNDVLYGQLSLGNRYPIDQIQSIEIIRGPGSAEYGGYAEQAVVSVHTRSYKDLKGISVTNLYGRYPNSLSRQDLSITAAGGQDAPDGFHVSFNGLVGQGNRSDGTYVDQLALIDPTGAASPSGSHRWNMTNDSQTTPFFLNLGADYKGFTGRIIYDNYKVGSSDGTYTVDQTMPVNRFKNVFAMVKYDSQVTEKFKLTPRVDFQWQQPWNSSPDGENNVLSAYRVTGSVTGAYDILDNLSVSAGVQAYVDHANYDGVPTPGPGVPPGATGYFNYTGTSSNSAEISNVAVFAEGLYDSIIGNFIAGVRYEHNSQFGSSFVPRAGLTKKIDRFHFKLLFSGAFRAPGIQEISLTNPGSPTSAERLWVEEVELGYQFTDHMFLSVNLFNSRMNDFITLGYTDPAHPAFANAGSTGSRGVEADYKVQYRWGSVDLNYSFYNLFDNHVYGFTIPGVDDMSPGFPQHKLTLSSNLKIWRSLSFNPSVVYMSPRWAFTTQIPVVTPGGVFTVPQADQLDSELLLNGYFLYRDLGIPGLDLGVGVYNILNQGNPLIQDLNAFHAPTPGPRRDIFARLTYTHAF